MHRKDKLLMFLKSFNHLSVGKNFSLFFFVHISTNLNTERYTPIALKPMLCEVANTKFKKIKNSLAILHNGGGLKKPPTLEAQNIQYSPMKIKSDTLKLITAVSINPVLYSSLFLCVGKKKFKN